MGNLSFEQEVVLAVFTIVGSLLSLIGSSLIMFMVIRRRKYKTSTYHRLLFHLSFCDFIFSIGWFIAPWTAPADSSKRYMSIGNTASCSFTGFCLQYGTAVAIANANLSIYYLLTIRMGIKGRHLVWRERIMHSVVLVYGIFAPTLSVFLGLFNELTVGQGCWCSDFPKGCRQDPDVPCIRGQAAFFFGYILGGIPVMTAIILVIICNYLVYEKSRKLEEATSRRSSFAITSSIRRDPGDVGGGDQPSPHRRRSFSLITLMQTAESLANVQNASSDQAHSGRGRRPSVVLRSTDFGTGSNSAMAFESGATIPTQQQHRNKRTKKIAAQATHYVVIFTNSLLWQILLRQLDGWRVIVRDNESSWFLLILVAQFFSASTGIGNLWVYIRPRYLRNRRRAMRRFDALGGAMSFSQNLQVGGKAWISAIVDDGRADRRDSESEHASHEDEIQGDAFKVAALSFESHEEYEFDFDDEGKSDDEGKYEEDDGGDNNNVAEALNDEPLEEVVSNGEEKKGSEAVHLSISDSD